VVKAWAKRFALSVVSGSNPVVAHMMATRGLHGRYSKCTQADPDIHVKKKKMRESYS
jgi:hypothetical protein